MTIKNINSIKTYIYYTFIVTCILLTGLLLLSKDDNTDVNEAFEEAIVHEDIRSSYNYIDMDKYCLTNIGSCIREEEQDIVRLEKRFVSMTSHEYLNEEKRKELLKEIEIKKQKVKDWKRRYKCFGTKKWHRTKEECDKNYGKWDKPCSNDYECPFFKKNKNYTNERGRCKSGICDMPLNVQIIGYTKFKDGDDYKPYCHNCRDDFDKLVSSKGMGPCCDEQRDRYLYPKLASPDYAFPGDEGDRKEFRI